MKRYFPPIALVLYAVFGAALLIQMSMQTAAIPEGWEILSGEADLQWDPETEKMTIIQHSRYLVLKPGIHDLNRLILKKKQPDAQVILKVDDGRPSMLSGILKTSGGIILINPNGIIVGPDATLDVGGLNIFSTLDIADQEFLNGGDISFSPHPSKDQSGTGTITTANGDVILLGNFVEKDHAPIAIGANGEIVIKPSSPGSGTHYLLDEPPKED